MPAIKCPRCQAGIDAQPSDAGVVVCPQCGARLKSRQAVHAAASKAPVSSSASDFDSVLARLDSAPEASAATPTIENREARRVPTSEAEGSTPTPFLESILSEIRAVRQTQEQILTLLRSRPTPEPRPALAADGPVGAITDDDESPLPVTVTAPVRSGRRKSVLLIDDDAETRKAAVAALEAAEIPVRTAEDGNAGVSAIAAEKPDIIVLELAVGGRMAGKDVVNMIKATMEWVDIPIVLYTRAPIANQKEARTIHGADELVPKGAGGAEALVARVVSLFRKG